MDRKTLGLWGVVLAFFALIGPGKPDDSLAAAGPGKRLAATQRPGPANAPSACDSAQAEDGPWRAVAEGFGRQSCAPDAAKASLCLPQSVKPRFLIAVVPDPATTHLALYFDRSVESLTWALADDGYALEHYWLPWAPTEQRNSVADGNCRNNRTGQPGLLIFHKTGAQPLMILLAGESPTSGVNQDQFTHAVDYVRANQPGADVIKVMGPSFSGSLEPLARLLQRFGAMPRFRFVSGMVTGEEAVRQFQKEALPASFESVLESDARASELFFRYVRQMWRMGQGPDRVAILAEQETAFGRGAGVPPEESTRDWITFAYPREISRLRNAYQEETDVSPGDAKRTTATGLRLTLKDQTIDGAASAQKDSIGAFSPLQSPASQQAALAAIAGAMRQERIDLAQIVATDVLDALFLARFLHTAAPETRLFTLDSDLLFLEQDSPSLDGMLSVTNYPLGSEVQDRERPSASSHGRLQFTSRYAEGVYNACRKLLDDGGKEASPGQQSTLWLTVAGRNGYWPLARLGGSSQRSLERVYPSRGWTLSFWLLLLFASAHAIFVQYLLGVWQGSPIGKLARVFSAYPESNEFLSPDEGRPARTFVLAANIALACSIFVMASPLVLFIWENPWAAAYSVCAALVFVLLADAARRLRVWSTPKARIEPATGAPGWRRHAVFMGAAWMSGLSICGIWTWVLATTRYETGRFFAYRSLNFASGVAPELPFLFACLALFYWSYVQIARESLVQSHDALSRERPRLPGAEYIGQTERAIRKLFTGRLWWPAAFILVLWTLVLEPWRNLRTLEYWPFGWSYVVLIAAVYGALAVAMGHLLLCWRHFSKFLQWLEGQPFRYAFSRLDKQLSRMPLVSGYMLRRAPLEFSRRGLNCLRAIESLSGPPLDVGLSRQSVATNAATTAPVTEIARIGALIQDLEQQAAAGLAADFQKYAELQKLLDRKALDLFKDLQTNTWAKGESASLQKEQERAADKSAIQPEESLRILKEEFLVLRYMIFIRYVLRHLQIPLPFLVWGFVLLVLSLESYAFQGHRWIDITSAVTFVGLGTGIAVVLAQMERDATLSRIMETKPNEIGMNFYLRLAQYGALPLLTMLTQQFPPINRFLFSWLQPALANFK